MNVANCERHIDRLGIFQRRFDRAHQLVIERLLQPMILLVNAVPRDARGQRRRIENRRQIDALGLPVIAGQPSLQTVHASHHFVKGAEAEARHVFAHLLGEEEEEVDHVLGLSGKARAQHRVLRGNAHGTGVEVALAHHDAAHA